MSGDESKSGSLLFFSWTFLLIIFIFLSNYNGLYGLDSHEYLRYCNRLSEFISTGIPPGDYFWPVNYPLLGAFLSFITGSQVALQLISVVSASWILYLLAMVLFREFPGREKEVIAYVILFLGGSPYFFRYSVSVMSDTMAIALACTCFYLIYQFVNGRYGNSVYAVPVFISLSVFTRFAMAPLLIPVGLFWIFLVIKKFRLIPFLVASVLSLIPVIIHFYFKGTDGGDAINHEFVSEWSVMNFFRNRFETIDGFSEYRLPNILNVFSFLIHPGYLFPGIVFLTVIVFKKNKPRLAWKIMIISMLSYITFLAGMPSRNDRFLIALMPFYLVICFPAYMYLLARFHNSKLTLMITFLLVFVAQVVFATRAFQPFHKFNKSEQRLAEKMKMLHPQVLYTFGMEGALRSYNYEGKIVTIWPAILDTIVPNSMLLFNREANAIRWSGKAPMINFSLLKDSANAVLIDEAGEGWEIYEIRKAYPSARTGFSR